MIDQMGRFVKSCHCRNVWSGIVRICVPGPFVLHCFGHLCQIAVGTLGSTDAAVLDSLCRRELLELTDDGYRLQVPLVQQYVRKKVQSLTVIE